MSRSTLRLVLLVIFVAGVVLSSKMRCSRHLGKGALGPPLSTLRETIPSRLPSEKAVSSAYGLY
ncbi:MAG: hypothetical protein ACAI34_25645 [Verrucomicrobium sp.]